MNRTVLALAFALLLLSGGCAKKEATTAPPASPSATQAPLPLKTAVTFNFTDVSVTTAGTILRLGFDIKNISKDPVLCDAAEFAITLSDGTVVQADTSAENKCDPDTIDPRVTSKSIMFFNIPANYTGPVVLQMTGNDAIVGKGTATVK